ncbi:MAG: hypothetical protein ACRYHA_23285 [Janthinobacterium lividum]
MIVIVSACALLLCIVVFMAGMQVGARLNAHVGNVGPAGVTPAAAVSASPTAAWPAAQTSGASSSNNSGE